MGTLGGGLGNTLYDAGSGLVSIPGQAVKGYKGETSENTAAEGVEAETEKATGEIGSQAKKADAKLDAPVKTAESKVGE